MNEPVTPEGFEENPVSRVRTMYWTGGKTDITYGIGYFDMDNNNSWIAMRDGLNLRKWA